MVNRHPPIIRHDHAWVHGSRKEESYARLAYEPILLRLDAVVEHSDLRTSSPRTAILSALTDTSIHTISGRLEGWFLDTTSKSALMIVSRCRGILVILSFWVQRKINNLHCGVPRQGFESRPAHQKLSFPGRGHRLYLIAVPASTGYPLSIQSLAKLVSTNIALTRVKPICFNNSKAGFTFGQWLHGQQPQ